MKSPKVNISTEHCCRHCLNSRFGIHLSRRDCRYWQYVVPCSCCGQAKHIVTGLRWSGKIKFFLAKPLGK